MPKNNQRDIQIINEVPALVYGVRSDDRIVFVNPYFTVVTGFHAEELKGANWRAKLHWSDRRHDDASILGFLTKDDAPSFYESELINKKGESRTIRWNHLLLRDEAGQLSEIIGFGTDMTNRQRADELAYQAMADLDRIFDAISDVVTIHDTDMRIIRVNKAACVALQSSPEELLGKHCYEVFRGDSIPCASCPEIKTLSDHLPHEGEIEHSRLGACRSESLQYP
ncbi:MAG: PAS domain-containing protein [Proteobacteria bacterium]|nr:PAS domain-containing protein [Pseudomonadota bacterium]MBU1709970.1 PAS domain-containing protein [Pseudomonadota bacterium]